MSANGRHKSLIGLLIADAVSLTGTRLSMLALPWFVLVSTGSVTRTGLVGFAEMAPYVVVKALGGPVVDRVGPRRVSVTADVTSAAFVGAIPLLYTLGALHFAVLLGLVALAGAVRGPGDAAKDTLIPAVVDAAQVPLERVTGLSGTIERLASTLGPALAGGLIALLGPVTVLGLDAASFAVAAVVIAGTAPASSRSRGEAKGSSYLQQLREGFDFLRGDKLLRAFILMVGTTNLLDAALFAVLLLAWARGTGGGAATVGLIASAMAATAMAGSAAASVFAHRLRRRPTYLIGYLVAGAPRFIVLTLHVPLWAVVAVWVTSGLGAGFLNPIISAVMIERIPRQLLGRVGALGDSMAWAGIPLGGPFAAALIALAGLSPALLACGAVYFLATTLPALRPEWREMDSGQEAGNEAALEPSAAT